MKRWLPIILVLLVLFGCKGNWDYSTEAAACLGEYTFVNPYDDDWLCVNYGEQDIYDFSKNKFYNVHTPMFENQVFYEYGGYRRPQGAWNGPTLKMLSWGMDNHEDFSNSDNIDPQYFDHIYVESGSFDGQIISQKKKSVAITESNFDNLECGSQKDCAQLAAILHDPLPAIFICGDYGRTGSSGEENSGRLETAVGSSVTQIITDMESGKKYLHEYICVKTNDGDYTWKNILDFPDYDSDGSPDYFSDNGSYLLDCNDRDPNQYFPTQIYAKFDGSLNPGREVYNICGDSTDNFCSLQKWKHRDGWNTDFLQDLVDVAKTHGLVSDNNMDLYSYEWLDNNDDCDDAPQSCEQNCKNQGGKCDYLSVPNTLNSEMDDESESDADDGYQTDDEYDWGDVETGTNFCCGAGLDDNGRILDYDNSEYLCVNREESFSAFNDRSKLDSFCKSDWCWLNSQDLPFESITIKGDDGINDVVSNSGAWYTCNESNIGDLEVPSQYMIPEGYNTLDVSRFSCFNAGDVNMWGECVSDRSMANSHESRVREAGESKMYLGNGSRITLYDFVTGDVYTEYGGTRNAGESYGLNLSDFDYLELYVKFEDIEDKYPVDLILTIEVQGQSEDSQIEIYNNNILGYSDFPYIVEGEYVRLRVPVDDWQDVYFLKFEPTLASLDYEIRNVQAIKEDESELYCSGQQASRDTTNAFLNGIDSSSDSDSDINSEDVCKQLYGEDAWLGFYYGSAAQVEEEFAACCGDKQNEYYIGPTEDLDGRGCFNGEVIYDGERAANVQYDVTYNVRSYTINNVPLSLGAGSINIFDDYPGGGMNGYRMSNFEFTNSFGESVIIGPHVFGDVNRDDYELYEKGELPGMFAWGIDFYGTQSDMNHIAGFNQYFSTVDLPYDDIYEYIEDEYENIIFDGEFTWDARNVSGFHVLDTQNFPISHMVFEDFDLPELSNEYMYWYIPELRKSVTKLSYDDHPIDLTLQLVAEYKKIESDYTIGEKTDTYTVPCLEDECVYALPGQPPYEITNNFPGLYDLYFVTGSNEEEQYLITEENQPFTMPGNIVARRVSKNVLMTNETFYSCEVPEYYFSTGYEVYGEQGARCDVQNGYVCSPQDADSLINTWSNIDLDEIGYTEVTEYVEGMEFQPRTCGAQDPCDVNELEYLVSPVPGRNLVPNANFYMSEGNNLIGWIMYDGQFDTDSLPYRENDSVIVPSGYSLKSDKIALYEASYTVSASSTCPYTVYGYTKEGDRAELGSSFSSIGYEYAELVFEGTDCTVTNPYLSVGSSLSEDFDDRYPFRSGAACCPEGACWNGYICVENMASYTFMTETVGEENYRCIDGDWYNLPPLFDWHGDEVGYCESEGQCFVTSSLSEGIMENASYTDFYNGEYPACINDGEFIFDHLCQDGEWSSRTKLVASSLLNYADGDDHILYCTDVRDALLDYKEDGYNYANYIEGESTTVVETTQSLDDAFDGSLTGNTTVSICYPELTVSETGRRLVPDEENTCVNNVCTIRYNDGGWNTMWGTSVNIDPRDSQSLFVPLGIAGSDTETFCDGDNDTWVECNDNIWFQDSMDSIIYTQEEIGMSQTVTESIVSFLSDLFGTDQIEDSEDYLDEASNFNKVYIASVDDYAIRAIEEIDGDQETIIAEYTGFETPVCDYVYNVNPSMVYVEQWPAVPEFLVNCTTDEDVSTVVTGTNRDFWWPQLTGMLRIE